jgi:hypothetical protein
MFLVRTEAFTTRRLILLGRHRMDVGVPAEIGCFETLDFRSDNMQRASTKLQREGARTLRGVALLLGFCLLPILLPAQQPQSTASGTASLVRRHWPGWGTGLALNLSESAVPLRGPNNDAAGFPGSDAGAQIAAAMADLPSTGGTVVADYKTPQTISRDIFAGVTKSVHLVLGGTTFQIGADMLVPRNVSLEFEHGAQLALLHRLDIAGRIIAPESQQIFTPVGTRMVRFSGGSAATSTQTSSTPPETYIYPQWWGAKGDGSTDDTAAITATVAAMAGTVPGDPPFPNNCMSMFLPSGRYVVSSANAIHLVSGHSGCGIVGLGSFTSVIRYTLPSNQLIYHNEAAGDGVLARFFLRDLGFEGPGATSGGSWFWDEGDSSTTTLLVDHVYVYDFQEGYHLEGTGAQSGSFTKFVARYVTTPFHLNNQESTNYELSESNVCVPPTGGDVFLFDQKAAPAWTILGGYLCTQGPSDNIFHFLSSYEGNMTRGNLTVIGTHIEISGGSSDGSQLLKDDSLASSKTISFMNVSAGVIDNLPRTTVTVVGKTQFTWTGGLLGGWVTLNTDPSEYSGAGGTAAPPLLSITDAKWIQGNNAYTAPVQQTCTGNYPYTCTPVASTNQTAPKIYYRNVFVVGDGFIPDQDTGP